MTESAGRERLQEVPFQIIGLKDGCLVGRIGYPPLSERVPAPKKREYGWYRGIPFVPDGGCFLL